MERTKKRVNPGRSAPVATIPVEPLERVAVSLNCFCSSTESLEQINATRTRVSKEELSLPAAGFFGVRS